MKGLWKVPAVAFAGGYIGWYILVYLLQFALVTLPDGTITADLTRQTAIYCIYSLAFIVMFGLLVMRKMTKKEAFFSSLIVVMFLLVLNLVSVIHGEMTGTAAVLMMRLSMPLEWTGFPSQLIRMISGEFYPFAAVIDSFVPFLFVLFGKKRI